MKIVHKEHYESFRADFWLINQNYISDAFNKMSVREKTRFIKEYCGNRWMVRSTDDKARQICTYLQEKRSRTKFLFPGMFK